MDNFLAEIVLTLSVENLEPFVGYVSNNPKQKELISFDRTERKNQILLPMVPRFL